MDNHTKPAKPYPEFPLFPHARGYWAKKIRGKTVYFGLWDDPEGALAKYTREVGELHLGDPAETDPSKTTMKELGNRFLRAKQSLLDSGELSQQTWNDYKKIVELVLVGIGKTRLAASAKPEDFAKLRRKMSVTWGPHKIAKLVQTIRSIFKFGVDSGLITPVSFGPGFNRPTAKTMRLHRAAQGEKLFTADDLISLIDAASVQMKAMILLGINCGFGNSDCGNLPISAINFDSGFVDYPRPKTGVKRRCHLWPETVVALQKVLEQRKEPHSEADAGILFITKYGQRWAKNSADSPTTKELKKLTKSLGITGTFYALRHTFRTVADEARDQPAADYIMGHESPHMSSHYRERISDERLKAVSEYVRRWLFVDQSGK